MSSVPTRRLFWMAALTALLAGCATEKPAGVLPSATQTQGLSSMLGTVLLAGDTNAAPYSFDQSGGLQESAGERAGTVAGNVLAKSTSEPLVDVVVGAGTLIVAPFAAAHAAIKARHRLKGEPLADSESVLAAAMQEMAQPPHFQQKLLAAANAKRPGQLLSIEQLQQQPRRHVDAVLQAHVEELRLQRAQDNDASYTLLIKVRTRLLRADGTVLYDQPATYRSEQGLFVDWARHPSIQSVADTGYRMLAAHLVEHVLAASDTPLLIGAGYRTVPGFDRYANISRVSARTPFLPQPGTRSPTQSQLQFIQHLNFAAAGTLGIYSTASVANVHLQKPQTRQEAHEEALQDVEWMMDGLHKHPNVFVAVPASAVAVPMSLWKQSVAIVRGLAPRTVQNAEAKLSEAANQAQPHQEVAFALAQCLQPITPQRVMMVKQPLPQGAENDPDLLRCLARGTFVWLPEGQTADRYLLSQGADNALEIHVLSANLEGPAGINPKLSLCVEAQATLSRPGDGLSFCSCPVRYRSVARTFTEWAAHDAEPFRTELRKCYRQLSAALADQLIQRGLAPEDTRPPATFASGFPVQGSGFRVGR
ncbi:MAG TPA: hypothetical protein VNU68_15180 [Verrucomicrobiae bacterium]|nr:hypothetical protein [Verrucomicrobiae bacterium]